MEPFQIWRTYMNHIIWIILYEKMNIIWFIWYYMIEIIIEPLTYGFFGCRILPKFSFRCFPQPMPRNWRAFETNIHCKWKDITISIHLGMNFFDTCDFKSESEIINTTAKYHQSTSKVSKVSVLNATLNSQSYPKRITSCSGWFSFEASVNSFARRFSGVEFLLPISTDSLDSNFSKMTQLTTSREVKENFKFHKC